MNGKAVAEGRVEKTQPNIFSADETADVGIDNQTPVAEGIGIGAETRFTGKINKITLEVPVRRRLHAARLAVAGKYGICGVVPPSQAALAQTATDTAIAELRGLLADQRAALDRQARIIEEQGRTLRRCSSR